jgi:hypothetical protein
MSVRAACRQIARPFLGPEIPKISRARVQSFGGFTPAAARLNAAVSRAVFGPVEPLTFGTAFAGSEAKLGLGVLARVKTKQVGELK